MNAPYLQATFRHGRPLAGYLYLRQSPDRKSHTTRRLDGGLLVDLDENGAPLGIEITAPDAVTLEALNRALRGLGLPDVTRDDLAPLVAA